MGKVTKVPQKKNPYNYQYNWEKTFPWVKKSEGDTSRAICTLCRTTVSAHKSRLVEHSTSAKHLKNKEFSTGAAALNKYLKPNPKAAEAVKRAEIQLSIAIGVHGSILAVDHIGENIKKLAEEGSILSELHSHPTKCGKILENVVAASFKAQQKKDLKGKIFSLLVDESTDNSDQKHLCFCARYFSETEGRIIEDYLGQLEVNGTTAEELYAHIVSFLEDWGLNQKQMIGFASDGAASVAGCHNSVWTRIRDANPHTLQIKCICHSLDLCVEHSVHKLPEVIQCILKAVPSHFSVSGPRGEFIDLCNTMNPDTPTTPPFAKYSETRWLNRAKIINNIKQNWFELLGYFDVYKHEVGNKKRFHDMYDYFKDYNNYLFFVFLSPIVSEIEKVNMAFQSSKNLDFEECFEGLRVLYEKLRGRVSIFDPDTLTWNKKETSAIDFGFRFAKKAAEHSHRVDIVYVQTSCGVFLNHLISEIDQRLPKNNDLFKKINQSFSPKNILDARKRVNWVNQPFLDFLTEDEQYRLEDQYRTLGVVNWTDVFETSASDQPMEKFWIGVRKYEDQPGNNPLKELADFVLGVLSLPLSTAVVERAFSQVTHVKNKYATRMKLQRLDALVSIKTFLGCRNICCNSINVSDDMLSRYSSKIYKAEQDTHADKKAIRYLAADLIDLSGDLAETDD